MRCYQVKDQLKDYVNGILDQQSAGEIRRHVAGCPNCARELSFIKEYLERLHSLPQAQAPAEILSGIRKRLNETQRVSQPKTIFRQVFPVLRWALPVCASVLVLICGISWWRLSNLWKNPAELFQLGDKVSISDQTLQVPASLEKSETRIPVNMDKEEKSAKIQISLQVSVSRLVSINSESSFVVAKKSIDTDTQSLEQTNELSEPNISEESKPNDRVPVNSATLETQLKDLLEKIGGKIIRTESEPKSKRVKMLTLKLPGKNYAQFIADLNQLGEIKQLTPEPSPVNSLWLEVEVLLLP